METAIRVLNRSQVGFDANKLSRACLKELVRASYLSQLQCSTKELMELKEFINEDK